MKQTLQLKLSQHLTLTPQLQQSIRLLQLSTIELNAEVERLLQENPLLEKAEDEESPAAEVAVGEAGPSREIEARDSDVRVEDIDRADAEPERVPEVPDVVEGSVDAAVDRSDF